MVKKKNRTKSTNSRGRPHNPILTEEHHPLIFQGFIKGWTLQEIVDELQQTYGICITFQGVAQFKNRHIDEYKSFRDEWLKDLKEIPLANQKVRVAELGKMYQKLSKRLYGILDEDNLPLPEECNLAGLIREATKILEQIQDEAGDKVSRVKGEGISPQTIIIENHIPGMITQNEEKENAKPKSRF